MLAIGGSGVLAMTDMLALGGVSLQLRYLKN